MNDQTDPTAPPPAIALSWDQQEAVEAIERWRMDETRQTFALGGYAGTGKTTVISAIRRVWDDMTEKVQVLIAAPTGKAAARLREKGVRATTIHQLAYRLDDEDEFGNPIFKFKGIGNDKAVVVIDEASMVNQEIYNDLIKAGYKMLFVGDHGQLPPVGGDPGIMRNLDYELSVIHRQEDDGLLEFAHDLRGGVYHPEAKGAVKMIRKNPRERAQQIFGLLHGHDVSLCWTNKSRKFLNHQGLIVGVAGEDGVLSRDVHFNRDDPSAALEHLVGQCFRALVLANHHKLGICNGEVYDFIPSKVTQGLVYGDLFTHRGEVEVVADREGFRQVKSPGQPAEKGMALLDFGNVLTVHKSQGSEWSSVGVWDDTFRGFEDRPRWAYTAATRAADRLTWYA